MKNLLRVGFLSIIGILSACTSQTPPSTTTTETTPEVFVSPSAAPLSGTLDDIKNQSTTQCTYTYVNQNITTEGNVYVDQGNVRNDIKSTIDGKTQETHIIIKDQIMSMWQSGQKTGTQMDYSKATKLADDAMTQYGNTSTNQTVPDLNQKYDYQCTPWRVDNTLFELPKDVTFTNFTTQLEQLQSIQPKAKLPAGASPDACGACNQLTGEQKIQCLQVIKC